MKIDIEFRDLLPALTTEELAGLEQSLINEGCQDSLKVWAEEDILIDGHNRYAICQKHGIDFVEEQISLPDRLSAMEWIEKRQVSQRNLSWDQKHLIMGRAYERTKKEHGGDRKSKGKSCTLIDTSETLAKQYDVSPRTIKNAAADYRLIADKPELQREILSKEKKFKDVKNDIRIVEQQKKEADRIKVVKEATERAIIKKCDCLNLLSSIPPIDLLLTDPPYFTDGDYTKQVSKYLANVKTTGQAYVFASSDPEEIKAYLTMDKHHMVLTQILVWNYNNTGQRQPKVRYNSNYQIAFYFRGADAPIINNPVDGTHQYACQTVNAPDGRLGDRYHSWQKPMALMERYILNSSAPGDLVCDPFAGTGTSLLAAAKNNRRSIGCDIDSEAVDIAIQRGCVYE